MGAAEGLLGRLQELAGSGGDGLLLYLGTAVMALLVLLLLMRRGGEEANGSGGRIRRAMSFTSAACAEGTSTCHAVILHMGASTD